MTNNLTYQTNNVEFNPLFEKMQTRFCQGGTIAEKLAKRANEYSKNQPKRVSKEFYMTYANSLPKKAVSKNAKKGVGKKLLSLRHVSHACIAMLVVGTVLVSGTAIGNLRQADQLIDLRDPKSIATETALSAEECTPWEEITTLHDASTASF